MCLLLLPMFWANASTSARLTWQCLLTTSSRISSTDDSRSLKNSSHLNLFIINWFIAKITFNQSINLAPYPAAPQTAELHDIYNTKTHKKLGIWKHTNLSNKGVFFSSLFSSNFDDQLTQNFHRFVNLCKCWDTASENTGLWHLQNVSISVFKRRTEKKPPWKHWKYRMSLSRLSRLIWYLT